MSEEVTRIIAAPIPHPRQTWLDYVRELGYQGSVPEDVRDLQESYYDILLAEQNYQKELRILKNGFLDGLRDVLPGTVTKILEEDVENLLIASQKLTVSLEGVYEENFILHNGVSDILDEMIQQRAFRPFQQYCMDYLYVHDRIQRYKTRRDFQTKLSELEQIISETNQESLKLEGLLPRPTSQIMKYARLLGEVIKKQEKCGDVDASIITRHVETHKEIKKIAALCDEAKRDKEKEVKVADCYKSFDFSEVPSRELPPWTMPRYLLYHQELQLKREIYGGGETKRSHIFLFTDLIVFTKPLRRGKFVIVDFCKLEDVFLLHSSNILEFHLLHNKIGSRVMMQFFCQKTEYWYTSLQSDPATQITEEGTYTNYKCHNLPEYKANEDHRATGFMTDLEFDAGDTIFLLWEFEDRSTLDVTYFGFNLRTREKGYLPRSKVTRVKNCSYDVSKERKRVFLMQPDAQERMRHYAQVNPQVRILLSSLNNVQGYG